MLPRPPWAPRAGRRSTAVRAAGVALLALLLAACNIVELEPGDPVQFIEQPQTSLVLASDGQVLAELHGEEDRTDVPLDAISDDLKTAVVSIEDRRFVFHAGVDVASIARAAITNAAAGEIEQGGSTITQQYVKNTMTGPARTLDRKLREAALAFQLEQRYSKDEILERYLNTVYFGKGAYGIAAASEVFFGVEPAELTLGQATLLAGMIQAPSRFDPYTDPDAAIARRRLVLDALVSTGELTRERAAEVSDEPLELAPPPADDAFAAPYVVAEVKRLLQHDPDGRFGSLGATVDERADAVFTGGLRVHTTLDPRIQTLAEDAVASVLTDPADPHAAVVVLDPRTGAVRAMVGGRDYDDPDDPVARFNLATQAERQPGSSFKPIVLALALERGVSLDRVFPGGACIRFDRVPGWDDEDGVCNYGRTAYGPLTLREATVRSVNTVYAQLGVELGTREMQMMAQALGIDVTEPVPAMALGAREVTPLELAQAYVPFATLGVQPEAHVIARIEAADGEVLYSAPEATPRVMNESVAYFVTDTLRQVVERGTGARASLDRPMAGKTGTSQDNADAWFVGYTPDLLAAVWVGFPEGRIAMRPPTTRAVVEGGRWPAEIWRALMEPALADVPATPFPAPEVDLEVVEVDASRNCLPNPYTPSELIEQREYLRGTAPTEICREPTGPPIEDVPDVVGLPLELAERILAEDGFLLEVRPMVPTTYPPGQVERQRPAPGGTTLESDGNAVVLWVAAPSRARVEVPSVVGLSLAEARAALEDAGWVVDVATGCPADGCPSPDEVWQQDPEAGGLAREHAVVTLSVPPQE
jgi:penicillin-binding protein 1A